MSCKHITVPYDFYKEYVRENPLFQERMNQRIAYVRAKHQLKNQEEAVFIQEYFVEVFSWTALSYSPVIPRPELHVGRSLFWEQFSHLSLPPFLWSVCDDRGYTA
jgi:hypothetical protein